ncbi:chemotaxis protein CheY [Pectobacterium betavasculorum]|uniref:DNA-binding dual transcriptional regulator OmpR n=1 Tax=Pectobacterium betavasculorum TaxID=55207 RepID=A0A093RQ91_9GAMM|nr:response regulator transcription factor [Pectobacterium betavasculorum]KFX05322.1 chemotaxis protein CheY [Pectobacterium betavasculorum]KFX19606.1 chemotaxis protein CheY [Pectobacterium betavasculorum]
MKSAPIAAAPRVLVVDDHRKIREPLAVYLRRQGFDVRTAESAAGMWLLLKNQSFDVVILDVMLPDGDGMALCQQLSRRARTSVILLTARGDAEDRIRGLDLGADDYVVKPFEPRELVARIRSVLRRGAVHRTESLSNATDGAVTYHFSGLCFSPSSGIVTDEREAISLSTMEGRLLSAFLQNPHTVMSRDSLIDLCVQSGDVFDRAIDRQVSRLRYKLARLGGKELLVTVWGSGYRLAADVNLREA